MKKIISVLIVMVIASMSFTIFANAENSAWETEPITLDNIISDTSETTTQPTTQTTTAAYISVKKCSVSSIKNKTYTAKKITPTPTIKYGNATLVKDKDYILTYKNNKKIGTATVIITGIGNYKDSVTKTFKIVPKGTKISKITKPKSKQVKITWKKQKTQTTGYQVQIATNSSFTKNKQSYTSKKNTTTNKVFKGLKKNKKYYVRIRTYKKVSGDKYCSSWSTSTFKAK